MANEVRLTTDPVRLKALKDARQQNKLAAEESKQALIREREAQQRLEEAKANAYEGVLKPGTVVKWFFGMNADKVRYARIDAAYIKDYGTVRVEYDVTNILKDGSLGQKAHLYSWDVDKLEVVEDAELPK